ncbi:MAG: hypothetical protein KC777_12415 [Cyanobacteria bacterium HKST-UBA02]|nr:hypothetical protein [Cyanobacteria bacterium HKST-UBA02]
MKEKGVVEGKATASVRNKTVTVATFPSKKQSTERDLKVTAILIAKEVLEEFSTISYVQAIFYDPKDLKSYRYVNVPRGLIDSFSKGIIDDEQMLSGLSVAAGNSEATSRTNNQPIKVKKGIHYNHRASASLKIQAMKLEGKETTLPEAVLRRIEGLVGTQNEYQIGSELLTLDSLLDPTRGVSVENPPARSQQFKAERLRVYDGSFQEVRKRIVDRLLKLEIRGIDIGAYCTRYQELEQMRSQQDRDCVFGSIDGYDQQMGIGLDCKCAKHELLKRKFSNMDFELSRR